MEHSSSLVVTLVAALGLAFIFGAAAYRLRLSPLVGYLVAGVFIGPFTPGFVADQALAPQLAEIGVILLMFGVGLHFSLGDLIAVRAIAVPGAVGQIVLVTLVGWGLALLLGWPAGGGLIFGLALSVASTVVVLRVLQERRLIETQPGKIAVGWLVVEDLVTVLALVMLPAFSGLFGGKTAPVAAAATGLTAWLEPQSIPGMLALTVVKVCAFVAVMLVIGRRVIPWVLHWVAHTGSRELFRLCVLVIALGVALTASELFGVSFALGAFFAGMILAESTLSQQAASETLPLRDAFAVLFFVSVGMLFDPSILIQHPFAVLATLVIVVAGNAAAAFLIAKLWGYDLRTALTLGIGLSQIGEFSFILATLGIDLGLLPEMGRDLILSAALLSIVVNPLLFMALERFRKQMRSWDHPLVGADQPDPHAPAEDTAYRTALTSHAVLVGYGRVGRLVGEALIAKGQALLVIEERHDLIAELQSRGIEAIVGNAGQPGLLKAANIAEARWLISAIPDPFESANLIEHGRQDNAALQIIARAHSDAAVEYLRKYGADFIIVGEAEMARGIVDHIEACLAE